MGLLAAKRLLDKGLEVVGFERQAELGGLWVYRGDDNPENKIYPSLRTENRRPAAKW